MAVPSWRRSPVRRLRRPGVAGCGYLARHDAIETARGVTAGGRRAGTGAADARMGTRRPPYLHRHSPGVEVLEGRPLLAAFVFDPDGPGVVPAQLINGLDFQPGDALA